MNTRVLWSGIFLLSSCTALFCTRAGMPITPNVPEGTPTDSGVTVTPITGTITQSGRPASGTPQVQAGWDVNIYLVVRGASGPYGQHLPLSVAGTLTVPGGTYTMGSMNTFWINDVAGAGNDTLVARGSCQAGLYDLSKCGKTGSVDMRWYVQSSSYHYVTMPTLPILCVATPP